MSRLGGIAKGAAYAGGAAGAIGGALFAAEVLAARRIRRRGGPSAAELLSPIFLPTHTVKSFDGTDINVVDIGKGIPLVFIHGVTLSTRTWVRQYEALPDLGYRVIAIDQRGHGVSTVGEYGHGVEHLGDDVAAVIETLDLQDAILVGHSMGGIAVQSFAIRHPELASERIKGFILLSTLCKTPGGSHASQTRSIIDRVIRKAPDTTRLWEAKNVGFLLARAGFGREPYPSEIELVRQMLSECPRETRIESPRALIGMDLTELIKEIDHPTLVISGTADLLTPPFHAKQLHEAIEGSRLEIVEGAGHMLMLERAEWLHDTIDAFARDVSGLAPRPALGAVMEGSK